MKTTLTLLLLLTALCTATEGEGVKTRDVYAAIGSSVSFPGVEIDGDAVYDLRRSDKTLVLTCHGVCSVRDPYAQRGQVYGHNKTFVLRDLKAKDSGIYESETNFKVTQRIYLWVMAPVKDPVLLKQEMSGNGSQCWIVLTCHTEGLGPFNFTFLKNGKEVLDNVVTTDKSVSLLVNGWDPKTSGSFSCNVKNAISAETSPSIKLLPPAKPHQLIMALIVIGCLLLWILAMPSEIAESQCWRKCQRQRANKKNGNDVTSGNPGLTKKAFAVADALAGFIKEGSAAAISVYGGFIPQWCCVLLGCFLLCRTTYWIIVLVNRCKETRDMFSTVKGYCGWAMWLSNVVGVPVFCVAVLVIFSIYYDCLCGMMYMWLVLLILLFVFIGFTISYTLIRKKLMAEEGTDDQREKVQIEVISHVANGDNLPPLDNGSALCEGHQPGVVKDIPFGNQETPEQEASRGNVAEGGLEEPSIPEPEGQPQVAKKIPSKSRMRATPDREDSDGTKDGEKQRLLNIETEAERLEDREANG